VHWRPPLPQAMGTARQALRTARRARGAVTRGRALATTAGDHAVDVLQPLIAVGRGLRRQGVWLWAWWRRTPKERRGPVLFLAAAAVITVAVVPHGPLLAAVCVMAAAGWAGREPQRARSGPSEAALGRLQTVYEALTPYFSAPNDPKPLYRHDGTWQDAFTGHGFDDDRLVRLHLRYPAWFTDQEPASRARIEHLLHAKIGRGHEYRFTWYEQENQLLVTALPPLPADIPAQRFVTGPGETVLGFTDAAATDRTTPVTTADGDVRQAPPIIWRTGPRATEAHLLAIGHPGSGTTNLLRSLAFQALQHGDLLVIDGSGSGEYACLAGRPGVLAVETGLTGTLAALEWAAHETERRLIAVNRSRQWGRPVPEDTRRPLWILVDRPTALSQLAAAEERTDPQSLLETPLRHGRAAGVTVAVADCLDCAHDLAPTLTGHTRARVALGPLSAEQVTAVLGTPAPTTPTGCAPPGRGYVRLGSRPPLRLQVPFAPDPYDDDTADAQRQAVLELLPVRPVHSPAATGPAGPAQAAAATATAFEAPAAAPGPRPRTLRRAALPGFLVKTGAAPAPPGEPE
jgi:hypothetical protein